MKKISILTPTRGRPKGIDTYYKSLVKTAQYPDAIELLLYIDNDDPALRDYEKFFRVWEIGESLIDFTTHVGEPISISKSWNVIAAEAQGDILLMGNDDLIAKTFGWDTKLREVTDEYPDDIYCAFFDDGINAGRHCAFPAVSRKWYETLGYFSPGIFEFFYNDTWLFDIAKRINRVRYIPEVQILHNHWTKTKIVDATTLRHRKGPKAEHRNARDKKLFENTTNLREVASNKLREVMGAKT